MHRPIPVASTRAYGSISTTASFFVLIRRSVPAMSAEPERVAMPLAKAKVRLHAQSSFFSCEHVGRVARPSQPIVTSCATSSRRLLL